ncbi:hypothetical protein HYFRA_00004091 [Hymenoscyphus fraxineus]|uniref:WD40 repeat-like protein n=1 Tax=Hymenoscyphus fraxineus TaxID=746836 RepID=A0A9N9KN72_9HELO|nr:hypothetical protein HYFRA_00004091 [Hymenoscyphus fraxineus]
MDIHRCRFVHYPPSTINALAFSKSNITEKEKTAPPRLAVGRANGDIEIWNPLNGSWLQETTIRGGKDRSIDGLVWTQDPNEENHGSTIIGKSRLFSIGYTTTVTEWDLEKGVPLRHASGNHGEIWCLAAQPPLVLEKGKEGKTAGQWEGQHLIAGCSDGALVVYSTEGEDLQLQKVLIRPSSKRAKIISVTFKDRNIVVAGCSDSTIRIFDIRNGALLRSMSLGAGPAGGPKEIIVWSVKVLNDGTIVSGDSTGELRIWNGELYTQQQRIKSHRQDILSLATSADGSIIISGGMDRRTVVYKQVGKGKLRWAEASHRRYHKHDVKSMASFESSNMSVVVSGGPDASPMVMPLSKIGFENQRALPFLPQEPIIQSSTKLRLMMSWWDREINIWRLGKFTKPVANPEVEEDQVARDRKLVAKILIKGEANITSASLSTDGSLLAVATAEEIKMFQLRQRKSEDGEGLRVSKVNIPLAFSSGARMVQFSPNGQWLCIIRSDSKISVARVISGNTSASSVTIHPQISKLRRIDREVSKNIRLGGLGSYDRTISQIAFSSDDRILAVSDLSGYIDTYILAGDEDLTLESPALEDAASSESSDSDSDSDSDFESPKSKVLIYGQQWTRNPSAILLPRLPATPTILSFRPATSQKQLTNGLTPHPTRSTPHPISNTVPTTTVTEDRLLIVTAEMSIFEFHVLAGSLTPWSRRNPTSTLPDDFRKLKDLAKGCLWNVNSERSRAWIYGAQWMWMIDLNFDFPLPDSSKANGNSSEDGAVSKPTTNRRKRKHGKDSGAGGAIPDSQLGTGISRKMQRLVHEEVEENQDVFVSPFDDEMDIDEDESNPSALERLRRESLVGQERNENRSSMWHTYKYRPILGVVVLGEEEGQGIMKGKGALEVAIVERPLWEVEIPPRFYGDQEWEKGGVDRL